MAGERRQFADAGPAHHFAQHAFAAIRELSAPPRAGEYDVEIRTRLTLVQQCFAAFDGDTLAAAFEHIDRTVTTGLQCSGLRAELRQLQVVTCEVRQQEVAARSGSRQDRVAEPLLQRRPEILTLGGILGYEPGPLDGIPLKVVSRDRDRLRGRFLGATLEKLPERGPHHPPRCHDVRVDLADTLGSLAHRAQDYRSYRAPSPPAASCPMLSFGQDRRQRICCQDRPPLDSGT